jgi:hypothetical protein
MRHNKALALALTAALGARLWTGGHGAGKTGGLR